MATKTDKNGTGVRVTVPDNGTASPTVTMDGLETLIARWANLSSKDGRLFSALCAAGENPESAVSRMLELIGEFRSMSRAGASKAFTFPGTHTFHGMTGRDALNAITDDRESNGKVRTLARDKYKIRK